MAKRELTNKELDELAEKIFARPELVKELSEDTLLQFNKFRRTRGFIKPTQWACISFINWEERLMQRLYLTAANGYIFRALEDYRKDIDASSPEAMQERMNECTIIEKFLNDKLFYNPDKHVRSSAEDLDKDILIESILTSSGKELSSEDATVVDSPTNIKVAYDAIKNAVNVLKTVTKSLEATSPEDPMQLFKEKHDVLVRRLHDLNVSGARIAASMKPELRKTLKGLLDHAPPDDNIHYFDRYISENFTDLKEITSAIFNVPKDLGSSIWFHGATGSLVETEKFMHKIHKELAYGAVIASNGGLVGLAPDLEQKDVVRQYNNVDVMTNILDRAEEDQKIISKITKKKARRARKKAILDDFKKSGTPKNIKDPLGIKEYLHGATQFRDIHGSSSLITDEDNEEIVKEVLAEQGVTLEDNADEDPSMSTFRIMGMDSSGNFGEVDIKCHIPDEYAMEANAGRQQGQ